MSRKQSADTQQLFTRAFHHGNAIDDNVASSGWFVGQFVAADAGLRHQAAVELKWGVHPRGQARPNGPTANGVATTVSILIRGVFRTVFDVDGRKTVVTLEREGDYIVFSPDLVHDWQALEDCVVLSVRFPSVDVRGAVKVMQSSRG